MRASVDLIRLVVLTRENVRLKFDMRNMQVSASSKVNGSRAGVLEGDNAREEGTTEARAASIQIGGQPGSLRRLSGTTALVGATATTKTARMVQ